MPGGRDRAALVGRAPELKALERRLADAAAGDGGLLCIAGEAGVGKTRLAAELAAIASTDGMTTAWATCNPDAPAFWPWRQLLRALGGTNPVERVVDATSDATPDRFVLFDQVTERLRAACTEHAALVVFDDLQWADASTLRLLAFAVRELRTTPLLVLATYRDTDIVAARGVHDVVGELGSAASILRLAGLDVDAVGSLLVDRLGDRGRRLAETVHSRTGGNAFFVRELAHALERAPDETVDTVPPAVVSLIERELDRCSPGCRRMLAIAAVFGGFDLAILESTMDRETLRAGLDEAIGARLVHDDGRGDTFAHDIVRDAVLATLPARTRAELHWSLGEALRPLPRRADEAARHLEAGVTAGDTGTAITAALEAARRAHTGFAFERAVEHLRWALEHLDAAPAADRVHVELLLGDSLLRSGDWTGAGDAFERAAALARERGDADALGRAAMGFGSGLGGFEVRIVDHRQIALLEEAAVALGDESALASFVRSRLSVALSFLDEAERRQELAREALAMAERVGDPAAHAHALAAWCDAIAGPSHSEERLAAATEILSLARAAANPELALLGHRHRVLAFLELGDVTRAAREIGAFERAAARYPLPIVTWYVPLWRGMLALLRGDLDAAERSAADAARIGARAGSVNAVLLVGTLRQWVEVARGRFTDDLIAEMEATVGIAIVDNPQLCSPRAPIIMAALARGDMPAAREQLDALAARNYGDAEDSEHLSTLAPAAEAAIALSDASCASEIVALLQPHAGRFVVDGIGAAVVGAVDEFLGALELQLGDDDAGRAHLASAIEHYERLRAPVLLERATARLGNTRPHLSSASHTSGGTDAAELVREGAVWRFTYGGRAARIRDVKGVRDLALLLARPGEELHVSELIGSDVVPASTNDVVLDERAKREYRRRIAELEGDIDEAERDHDDVRASRARAELDAFVTELTRAVGLGGRDRRAPDAHERARQAVRARIRWAIDRIGADHDALGRHLDASVRTGSFCCYRPERPTAWHIEP